MVTGKKRSEYDHNSLPDKLDKLIGTDIGNGLLHQFNAYHITFSQAEAALISNSEGYKKDFGNEDIEVKRSMFFDPFHSIQTNPLLYVLREAYMITVHSVFESVWKDIAGFYNEHYDPVNFPALSYLYFTKIKTQCGSKKRENNFIDEIVENNQILFDYNYLRNSFAHPKGIGSDYYKVKQLINDGVLTNIRSLNTDSAAFEITSLQFVYEYGDKIISFLSEIQEKAYLISLS